MTTFDTIPPGAPPHGAREIPVGSPVCLVNWAAVAGGAVTICIVSFLLFLAGSGLGLSTISPWQGESPSPAALTAMAAIWLIVMQWLSAALGGYIAGRMRPRYNDTDPNEHMFRDSAHGLLSWSTATLLTLCLMTSAGGFMMRTGSAMHSPGPVQEARPSVMSLAQDGETLGSAVNPAAYELDRLFRSTTMPSGPERMRDARLEASRILMRGAVDEAAWQSDKAYLAQLVASSAGISQTEADQRVNDLAARSAEAREKAKQTADEARKAGAKLAFYAFFSMLIGAFIASAAGALGGRHRDCI